MFRGVLKSFLIGLVCLGIICSTVSAAPNKWIPNPPQRRFKEVVRFQKFKTIDGITTETDGRFESTVVFDIDDDLPRVTFTLINTGVTTDGKLVPKGLDLLMLNRPIAAEIDSNDQLTMIRGYAGLQQEAKNQFPPERYKDMAAQLSAEALSNKLSNDWNSRQFLLKNRSLEPGTFWEATRNILLTPESNPVAYSVFWIEPTDNPKSIILWAIESTDFNVVGDLIQTKCPNYRKSEIFFDSGTPDSNSWTQQIRYRIERSTNLVLEEKGYRVVEIADPTAAVNQVLRFVDRRDRRLIEEP
ncbi:hypothetical protein EB093_02340 [bacterium]|nr:hypothetical protein [bacterium]